MYMGNKYGPYDYNPFDIHLRTPPNQRIPFRTIFQAKSGGFSSKRICGVVGWAVLMFCFVWCVIQGTPAPDFSVELVGGCVALLGVDKISEAIGGLRGPRGL